MSSCCAAESTARTRTTPNPGPLGHRTCAELVGGPLDGLLLDIHGWRTEEADDGVALSTELGQFPGGRALYDPARAPEPRTPGPGVVLTLASLPRVILNGQTHRNVARAGTSP